MIASVSFPTGRTVELHIDCPDCSSKVTQTITEDTLREISQASTDEEIAECLPEIAVGVSGVISLTNVVLRVLEGYNTIEEARNNLRDYLKDEDVRCGECGAKIPRGDGESVDLTEEG